MAHTHPDQRAILGPNDRRAIKNTGKQIRDDIRLFRVRAASVEEVVRALESSPDIR